MSRRERPLESGDGSLGRFAEGLRQLRRDAGSPTYRELGQRARYSAGTLSDAAGGRKLPSLAVTLAYVRACGGDVAAWERAWHEVNAEIEAAAPPPVDDSESPYVGLAPFQPADAERFFGRDVLVEDLLLRLKTHRFVTVFGPSGVGKSSLLRAGVVPRIDAPVVLFTPGTHPMEVYRAQDVAADAVLVVDQFEEVFTLCASAEERVEFIDSLLETDNRVMVGIRADFYSHCATHPGLARALSEAQMLVGPMGAGELRAAITQPAVRAGYVVEGALVAELVAESAGQPGLLPMVSHVLRETWHRRRGNTLTRAGYQAAGGIQGALAKTAEDLYASFTDSQKTVARQLFLRLTALGEGTEDTKRRITRAEFDGADEELNVVLTALATARLITMDTVSVEMSHESLIRAWPRLRGWLTEDRDGLRIHRQLIEAALAWESLGRDPGALYRGTRLQLAYDWPGSAELVGREREFLDASYQAFLAEREAARRRARRLRQLSTVLAVLLVVAVVATFVAFQAQGTATEQRNTAISQKIASQSEAMRAVNPALAAQLALAAYRLVPTTEARSSLLSTFAAPYATQLAGHADSVNDAVWSPDGRMAATASDDDTVALWDVTDPHRPRKVQVIQIGSRQVYSVAFRHDGKTLATSGEDGVKLWDISDLNRPRQLSALPGEGPEGETRWVYSVTFNAGGDLLAATGEDHKTRLYDVSNLDRPVLLSTVEGNTDRNYHVAFQPGDHYLVTAGGDGTVRFWNIDDRRAPRTGAVLTQHVGRVTWVEFSPDGHTLATTGYDRTVRLWDVTNSDEPRQKAVLDEHTARVKSVAFSPDGRTLASSGDDRTVRLWDLTDPNDPHIATVLTGHAEMVWTVRFSPDGRRLLTTSWDRTARIWDLAGPGDAAPANVLAGHENAVYGIAFSPAKRTVVTSGDDGRVKVWDVTDPVSPRYVTTIADSKGGVRTVEFSPNGGMLATGGADGTIRLYDMTDQAHPQLIASLAGHTDLVYGVAFNADATRLASVSQDNSAVVWDISDPKNPRPTKVFERDQTPLYAVGFGPGGLLVIAGFDQTVQVWDVHDLAHPHVVAALTGHTDHINTLTFSPDGKTLATAGADATVRLWNMTDPYHPTLLGTVSDHAGPISTVSFSADGHTIATASDDHTARLWDVTDPAHITELATLSGHSNRVWTVAFGADGHTVATASDDHLVILHDMDVERVATRVCATAYPRITQAQWDQYLGGIPYNPPCP